MDYVERRIKAPSPSFGVMSLWWVKKFAAPIVGDLRNSTQNRNKKETKFKKNIACKTGENVFSMPVLCRSGVEPPTGTIHPRQILAHPLKPYLIPFGEYELWSAGRPLSRS